MLPCLVVMLGELLSLCQSNECVCVQCPVTVASNALSGHYPVYRLDELRFHGLSTNILFTPCDSQ